MEQIQEKIIFFDKIKESNSYIYMLPKFLFNSNDYSLELMVFEYNRHLYEKIKNHYKYFTIKEHNEFKDKDTIFAFIIIENINNEFQAHKIEIIEEKELHLKLHNNYNNILTALKRIKNEVE